MIDIGYFSLCTALVFSGYATIVSFAAGRKQDLSLARSGENAALVTCCLLTLAVIVLWHALLTHNFRVQFVAENSDLSMPVFYLITSLWGGQAGSLLFWGWILSLYAVAVIIVYRNRYRDLMPYAVAVISSSSFFYCILHLFSADPFTLLPTIPENGRGLNPLLQQPLMAIHPPLLYLGMVGMVVPFSFAISALLSGNIDATWLRPARRWMLIPWSFLGAGLLLGGKWAYVELGWGGYWGWDPVENSSLMPWLAGTAFLHSIMVQERRGMLKVWNFFLAILCYSLCILGTFITRSGIISSVHAFAESNIGPFFVTFLVIIAVLSAALLYYRLPKLGPENKLESFVSRETAFLLNNWILLGILFAVLWGTLFPLISEAFTGQQITIGPPFFNQVNTPLGLILIFLTGAGPLVAWRKSSTHGLKKHFARPLLFALLSAPIILGAGVNDFYAFVSLTLCCFVVAAIGLEFHTGTLARKRSTGERYFIAMFRLSSKNRRRYGGYITHVALVLLFVGFTGKAFTTETELVLQESETRRVGEYDLTFETLAYGENAGMQSTAAVLSLHLNGERLGTLLPERRYYKAFDQGTTEVSIYSGLLEDFYLILVGWSNDGSAKFQIYINPLVKFVWLGSIVLIFGSIWAMWPTGRDRRVAKVDTQNALNMNKTVESI